MIDGTDNRSLWDDAGRVMGTHPELLASAGSVRGFGGGARWMHHAMRLIGWRLPPFSRETSNIVRVFLKYGICVLAAAGSVIACVLTGFWQVGLLISIPLFCMVAAKMVFLFPVVLAGSRSPWCRSYALTAAAGGTWRVMVTVLPITVRMLTGFTRPEGVTGAWCRGCLSIVLWHRRVCKAEPGWSEAEESLPRLEIGPCNPLLLRREIIDRGLREGFRVLWISDLHWRGAGDAGTLLAILRIARHTRPHLFILGGDFLDCMKASGLFRVLVRRLAGIAPCVALPGNHDSGRTGGIVRDIVTSAGGIWLPDHPEFAIHHPSGERLAVMGCSGLLGNPGADVRLLCVHNPAEITAGKDLPEGTVALAGHLHGGQWVLWKRSGHLFPAAWAYRHNCLRKAMGGSELIVCRGAGDTLPLRWNCPREVVLCEIL